MNASLKDELRHAGVGILLGLLGLVFGISWAVYMTVNHEGIHRKLLQAEFSSIEEKFVLNSGAGEAGGAGHAGHDGHSAQAHAQAAHDHSGHSGHAEHEPEAAVPERDGQPYQIDLMRRELDQIKQDIAKRASNQGRHGSPEMAEAHQRLARGHVHAMGLGIMSVAVSMLLAWLPASPRSKTFAAACVGTGSLFYPLSWILMGMRTTAMGSAVAEASVLPMVALSLALIGIGLLFALAYTIKWLLKG